LKKSTLLEQLFKRDPSFSEKLGYGSDRLQELKLQKEMEMPRVDHNVGNRQEEVELVYEPSNLRIDNTTSVLVKEKSTDQPEEREIGEKSPMAGTSGQSSSTSLEIGTITAITSW